MSFSYRIAAGNSFNAYVARQAFTSMAIERMACRCASDALPLLGTQFDAVYHLLYFQNLSSH
jgi:hypothetical protein